MASNLNIKNANGKTVTLQNPDTNNADIVIDGSKIASTVSPVFTGNPTAPTQTAGDNSTKVATTAFVSESPQVCKAWVNFNGVPLSGTYSQSGTTITVTMAAHGMETGMRANLDFTSGTATDGIDFVVTNTGANTFTVVGKTSVTTSGNVTRNCYIREAFNVSSITDNGVGNHRANLTISMPTLRYSVVVGIIRGTLSVNFPSFINYYNKQLNSVDVICTYGDRTSLIDETDITMVIFY